MIEPANSRSAPSSARSVSTSRSFDGSSSISTLAPAISVLARWRRPRSPPDRVPTSFCWSLPLKLKLPGEARVGAARHRELADDQVVEAAGDVLPDRLRVLELLAALFDERHLRGGADLNVAAVGLFLAGNHAEQGRLGGAVRADDADDRARRHLEAQLVDQQAI